MRPEMYTLTPTSRQCPRQNSAFGISSSGIVSGGLGGLPVSAITLGDMSRKPTATRWDYCRIPLLGSACPVANPVSVGGHNRGMDIGCRAAGMDRATDERPGTETPASKRPTHHLRHFQPAPLAPSNARRQRTPFDPDDERSVPLCHVRPKLQHGGTLGLGLGQPMPSQTARLSDDEPATADLDKRLRHWHHRSPFDVDELTVLS